MLSLFLLKKKKKEQKRKTTQFAFKEKLKVRKLMN